MLQGRDAVAKIDRAAEFHQIGFPRHIGEVKTDGSPPALCTCFQCQFCDLEHNPIPCKFWHNHSKPCKECVESFEILLELFALYDKVKRQLLENNVYENQPILQDDMDSWEDDIHQFLRNLLDY